MIKKSIYTDNDEAPNTIDSEHQDITAVSDSELNNLVDTSFEDSEFHQTNLTTFQTLLKFSSYPHFPDISCIPIFILTLTSDPKRVNHVTNVLVPRLKQMGFIHVKCFQAVNGKTRDLEISLLKMNCSVGQNCRAELRKGQLACFLSHLEIWQYCIDHGLYKAIVLEDDALVTPSVSLDDFRDIYHELPATFDFLYLYTPEHQIQAKVLPGKQHVTVGYRQWCTVGYLINNIPKLRNLCLNIDVPIDNHLSNLIESKRIDSYSCRICPIGSIGQLGHVYKGESLSSNIYITSYLPEFSFFQMGQSLASGLVHYKISEKTTPDHRLVEEKLLKTGWFQQGGSRIKTWTQPQLESFISEKYPNVYQFLYTSHRISPPWKNWIELACVLYEYGGVYFFNTSFVPQEIHLADQALTIFSDSQVVYSSINHPFWLHLLGDDNGPVETESIESHLKTILEKSNFKLDLKK